MHGRGFLLALFCAVQLAPAPAQPAAERATVNRRTGLYELPLSELRKAAERGDRAELARTAGRLGPARLGKALGDLDRRLVLAALDAAPLVPASPLLLERVAALLTANDAEVRARAVAAVAALLREADPERMTEWEVPSEAIRLACQGLAAVAYREGDRVPTRLLAVQGLAEAGRGCAGVLRPQLLFASETPELRRAAVLAWAPEAPVEPLLAAARDPDGRVAAAAGARLCQRSAKPPAGQPPLHELALARGAEPEDVVDLLPCLFGATELAPQRALEELRERGPGAVREAIKAESARRLQP